MALVRIESEENRVSSICHCKRTEEVPEEGRDGIISASCSSLACNGSKVIYIFDGRKRDSYSKFLTTEPGKRRERYFNL